MSSLRAYLSLLRWPGAVTAAANVATGFLLAHRPESAGGWTEAVAVIVGGALVYLGGVVLNDVADVERDRTLHPERPLPSGRAQVGPAAAFGAGLVAAGIIASLALAGLDAGLATVAAAAAALTYDFGGKRFRVPGSLLMGLARGFNALAGCIAATGGLTAFLDHSAAYGSAVHGYAPAVAAYTVLLTFASTMEERRPTVVSATTLATLLVVVAALAWPAFPARWPYAPALALAPLAVTLIVGARRSLVPDGPGLGALIREAVFGFLLVDAAWLLGSGRYDAGFWLILLYVALRFVLSRARS